MTYLPAPASEPLRLLNRILETPGWVEAIRDLDARVLRNLIHAVGLEDAGEIIALATTDQLVKIFDEDLGKTENRDRRNVLMRIVSGCGCKSCWKWGRTWPRKNS